MADCQEFCLRWNNFQSNITHQFETLRDDEDFVDVTLTCGGKCIKAHKVVLSACSPYFKELLKNNPCKHPIIFMRDVEFTHLKALVAFMYAGVVNVAQAQLAAFLRTAEALHILGLTEGPQLHTDLKNFPCGNSSRSGDAQGTAASGSSPAASAAVASAESKEEGEEKRCSSPSLAKRAKTSNEQRDEDGGAGWSGSGCGDADVHEDGHGNGHEDGHDDVHGDGHGDGDAGEAHPPGSTVPAAALFQQSRGGLVITPAEPVDTDMDQSYNDDLVDMLEPKTELPDYSSDGESRTDAASYLDNSSDVHGFGTMSDLMSATSSQGPAGQDGQPMESYQAALRKLHSLDPRPCPICQRMYSNLSNLRQHMRLIHIPQSVECPLCSRSFKTKLYLRRHLLSYHDIPVKWENSNANSQLAGLSGHIPVKWENSNANSQLAGLSGHIPAKWENSNANSQLAGLSGHGQNVPVAGAISLLNAASVISASVSTTQATSSPSVASSSSSAMPPPHSYLNVEEELKRTYIQSPHRVRSSCGVPVPADGRLHHETESGSQSNSQQATPPSIAIAAPKEDPAFPAMSHPFHSAAVSPVLHTKSEHVPDYMRSNRFAGQGDSPQGPHPQQQMGQFGARVGYSDVNVPFSENT